MKTEINKINSDWKDIRNKCRTTINKEGLETEPSSEFKTNLLISEHSPIRLLTVNFKWKGIKSWISVHFARHWLGFDKWISTQRTDRTGVDRNDLPQDAPVNMEINANAQALINVARYRLCYQASPETREYMEDLKCSLVNTELELANVLQKNCLYRCGCPEFKSCGYWEKFIENNPDIDLGNIKQRYEAENNSFYKKKGLV